MCLLCWYVASPQEQELILMMHTSLGPRMINIYCSLSPTVPGLSPSCVVFSCSSDSVTVVCCCFPKWTGLRLRDIVRLVATNCCYTQTHSWSLFFLFHTLLRNCQLLLLECDAMTQQPNKHWFSDSWQYDFCLRLCWVFFLSFLLPSFLHSRLLLLAAWETVIWLSMFWWHRWLFISELFWRILIWKGLFWA